MVHDGQSKRKLGDIWAHLMLSAFTLLVPPLGMAAGVMYLSSPAPQGLEQRAAKRADMRPEPAASQHPLIVEHPLDEGMAAFTRSQITKDPTRYKGPLQVETPPTMAFADLSAKVPEQVPAPLAQAAGSRHDCRRGRRRPGRIRSFNATRQRKRNLDGSAFSADD